jgi:hypothetical protein
LALAGLPDQEILLHLGLIVLLLVGWRGPALLAGMAALDLLAILILPEAAAALQ